MMTPDQSDADVMKYAMFGGSELTEKDKLTQSMGEVDWSYLAPHYKSGSLYFVDPQLSLVEVGLAFTENRKDEVEAWLQKGDLVKVEALHAAQWENKVGEEAVQFEALVVSPFVICRPV